MNPAKMIDQITFQQRGAPDAQGFASNTWTNIATEPTVWAEVKELPGREVAKFSREVSTREIQIFCYYRGDITPKHRILYDGVAWDIHYIRPLPDPDGMEIMAGVVK